MGNIGRSTITYESKRICQSNRNFN